MIDVGRQRQIAVVAAYAAAGLLAGALLVLIGEQLLLSDLGLWKTLSLR